MKYKETTKEITEKFKNGENVWTASLGGIGPGYELAIQALLWTLLERWDSETILPDEPEKAWETFKAFADPIADELNKKHRFSGAQVSSAMGTAFQFIFYGYSEMMNKLDEDRHILVSKNDWKH